MPILSRLLLIVLLLAVGTVPAWAQDASSSTAQPALATTVTPDQVKALSKQLDQIKQNIASRTQLTDNTQIDKLLNDARTDALKVQQQADQLVATLTPQNEAINEKLKVLGDKPKTGEPAEPAEVTHQRNQLTDEQTRLGGLLKQVMMLNQNSQELLDQIAALRHNLFNARISQRTASPLSLTFWRQLTKNTTDGQNATDEAHKKLIAKKMDAFGAAMTTADDNAKLSAFRAILATDNLDAKLSAFRTILATTNTDLKQDAFGDILAIDDDHAKLGDHAKLTVLRITLANAVATAWQPSNRLPFIVCLLAAVLLLALSHHSLEHHLLELAGKQLPSTHLRRSAMATLITLSTAVTYGLAAQLVYLALNWHNTLLPDVDDLLHRIVVLTFWVAILAGLGRALLSVKHPSWRLAPLSGDLTRHLRRFPQLLAGSALLTGVIERINNTVNASDNAIMAAHAFNALLIGALVVAALIRMGRARRALIAAGNVPAKRPLWVGLLIIAIFLGTVLTFFSLLTGYIALAFFSSLQLLRISFFIAALYLLMHLINDLCETGLSPHSRSGTRLRETFGFSPTLLEQSAIVLSGVTRAFALMLALPLILAPYGASMSDLISRSSQLFTFDTFTFGTLSITPSKIFSALLVLVVGTAIIRIIKHWVSVQVLPKTSLDMGMRMSIVTLLTYVGGIFVFVIILRGALDVGWDSITWIVSALSVGIGFGLQAIVQNLISGLILMVERPVKIGDWVSIGDTEGDIRRINMRATEIQQADRSIVIVPNSQLITQNVRNVTQASAQGRVQISLPMPLSSDPAKVRSIVLEILNNHQITLDSPPPRVQLSAIDTSSMLFLCTAYINNPREITQVKSDLLFEIIRCLRDAGLPLTTPQDLMLYTSGNVPAQPPVTAASPATSTSPAT